MFTAQTTIAKLDPNRKIGLRGGRQNEFHFPNELLSPARKFLRLFDAAPHPDIAQIDEGQTRQQALLNREFPIRWTWGTDDFHSDDHSPVDPRQSRTSNAAK
jgi:hypothetical protein